MDDLRDLAEPDNSDVDLLHWPSPHRLCHSEPARSFSLPAVKHTPYRLASHLRFPVCAGVDGIADTPGKSEWLCRWN